MTVLFVIQVHNYVCMLKNSADLNEPGVVINEMSTSRHDTTRISEMFFLMKSNYKKKYGTFLKFRIIGMDLSWATIHAALEIFNMETVDGYAKRIYAYSKSTSLSDEFSKSILSSCCSHTMHRFTRGMKRHVVFLNKEQRNFLHFVFLFY